MPTVVSISVWVATWSNVCSPGHMRGSLKTTSTALYLWVRTEVASAWATDSQKRTPFYLGYG